MNYNRYVADISSNNRRFDANTYRNAGHLLVGIKATEGTGYVNPNHRGWCYDAGRHHVGILHYHFARPDLGTDPRAEADHFLAWATPLLGPRDYVVLDIERATRQGWNHDPAWSATFDSHIQDRTRFATILYTFESVLRTSDKWLVGDRKRVWDAAWGAGPGYAPPGYQLALHQFTDGVVGPEPHQVAGVGTCDVSYMGAELFQTALRELP